MTSSRLALLLAVVVLALASTSCSSAPTIGDIVVIDDDLMRVSMIRAQRAVDDGIQEIDVALYRAEVTAPGRMFSKFQWALFHDLNRNDRLELSEGLTFATATPATPREIVEVYGSPTRAKGRVWLEAVVLMENGEMERRFAPVPGW